MRGKINGLLRRDYQNKRVDRRVEFNMKKRHEAKQEVTYGRS